MNLVFQSLKFILTLGLIISFGLSSLLASLIFWDSWKRRQIQSKLISYYSCLGLKIMGIQAEISDSLARERNFLIVSNHLSYLDILVLASKYPSCFVTSIEIKQTPFLGQLTDLGGCLYVERRNKKNIESEISQISEALRRGLNVTIFPEATSTNGESVLRFRRPLYNASIFSGRATLPICINYRAINGESVHIENRDFLYWYGDMSFLPHLWKLMSLKYVHVDLTVCAPIRPGRSTQDHELAGESHLLVSEHFEPCPAF